MAGRKGSAAQDARAPRGPTKTTLYIQPVLLMAVKRLALEAGLSLTAYIGHVLDREVALAHLAKPIDLVGEAASSSANDHGPADLRAAVQTLAVRLAALEQVVGHSDARTGTTPASPSSRTLSVREVREAVRAALTAHGAPMPHRDLLHYLVEERGLRLPGQDVSVNLRTILTHPRSTGFRLLRGQGYIVCDHPVLSQDEPK